MNKNIDYYILIISTLQCILQNIIYPIYINTNILRNTYLIMYKMHMQINIIYVSKTYSVIEYFYFWFLILKLNFNSHHY